MWTKVAVDDKEKIRAYLACYNELNCRPGNYAALRSSIKRSGQQHYLYEGDGFQLVLCIGVKNRTGRHTMFDVSYTPSVDVDKVAPLFLEKFRAYAEEHRAEEIHFALAEHIQVEGVRMLLNIAQGEGVALATKAAPPAFTEFTLRFDKSSAAGS